MHPAAGETLSVQIEESSDEISWVSGPALTLAEGVTWTRFGSPREEQTGKHLVRIRVDGLAPRLLPEGTGAVSLLLRGGWLEVRPSPWPRPPEMGP